MTDKLLKDIFEEKNEWIGPVDDIVLEQIIVDHPRPPQQPKSQIVSHTMKPVDRECAEWIVSRENTLNESKCAEIVLLGEEEQVMEQMCRFDTSLPVDSVDYLLSSYQKPTENRVSKPLGFPAQKEESYVDQAFFAPMFEEEQTILFLDASQGFDSKSANELLIHKSQSQLEESIRHNLFSHRDTESREIRQLKQFLNGLVIEMGKKGRTPKSQLLNVFFLLMIVCD
jgi:hypothetical protein